MPQRRLTNRPPAHADCSNRVARVTPDAVTAQLAELSQKYRRTRHRAVGTVPPVWLDTGSARRSELVLHGMGADVATHTARSQYSPPVDDTPSAPWPE